MRTIARKVRIGSTLHMFIGEANSEGGKAEQFVNDLVDGLTPGGDGATLEDGTRIWLEWVAVVNVKRTGADCYRWDKSGNRCLYELIRVKATTDGQVHRCVVRRAYRKLED